MFNLSSHHKTTCRPGIWLFIGLQLSLMGCGLHNKVNHSLVKGSYYYGIGSGASLEHPKVILETDAQRARDAIHAWLTEKYLSYKVLHTEKTVLDGRHIQRWKIRYEFFSYKTYFFDITASRDAEAGS